MSNEYYSLKEIRTLKKFREMSVKELASVLNHQISYGDFRAIQPDGENDFAREKAIALKKEWAKEGGRPKKSQRKTNREK